MESKKNRSKFHLKKRRKQKLIDNNLCQLANKWLFNTTNRKSDLMKAPSDALTDHHCIIYSIEDVITNNDDDNVNILVNDKLASR